MLQHIDVNPPERHQAQNECWRRLLEVDIAIPLL
jgi:hypothetical protein